MTQPTPNSLCILRLSALGDVTHVLPIIHTLRTHWPTTRLTWVIGKLEAQLVGDLPDVEFIVFDKSAGWRGFRDLRRQLANRQFDVALLMQVSLRANLAGIGIKSPLRIGYDKQRSKDGHGLFVNRRIPATHGQHVVDSFFSFLSTAGLEARELNWNLPIPDSARAFAETHLPGQAPTLIINPCASHARRNWLPERYAALADHAANVHGMRVVLSGGPSALEREMGEMITTQMQSTPINLIGKDTLKQFLGLLEKAHVLITPDSGPAHMAAITGTPVLGLYAASNVKRSGPYFSRQWCVDKYDEAAKKFKGKPAAALPWGTKLEFPGVMDLIRVEEVKDQLDRLMKDVYSRSKGT